MCQDQDGDGFGVGCSRGADCDDNDAEVTVDCTCDGKPAAGCPCDQDGALEACGLVYNQVGGTLICGQGVTRCSEGVWGECIINGALSVTLKPALGLMALADASKCSANPCDPNCATFDDNPDDVDLEPDAGVQTTDAGLTLTGDPDDAGPPIGGGFGCEGGRYPATTGGCAHHVCETGEALDPSCDEIPGSTTTVTLFSDDFSSGNAKGWGLDTSWEIGAATSSNGQTTGNGDPSRDHSDGSDDRIAGTVIGGNIGGGSVLFSDTFSSLYRWTETGEGDWDTESVPNHSGYPSSGSGSDAAHCDNCDSTCAITLSDPLDLSGYSSASLDFLRYVGSNLDYGEYLRLDAYNGSSWNTLFDWTAWPYGDGRWHEEHFDLSSYLVSGFRLRFVTHESSSSEDVFVDDVAISVPPTSVARYLTSPSFDGTVVNGSVTLQFQRWLNIEAPSSRTATVEVYDGSDWVQLWANTDAVSDDEWTGQELDLTPYKNAQMRVRFGWSGAASSLVSGWNLDDIEIDGQDVTAGTAACVQAVCDREPSCCNDTWGLSCLELIDEACGIACSVDTQSGECVACHSDPNDTTDYDGDGFSAADGDCLECDPNVNPGAWDVPGNSVDDDCDGVVDNGTTGCDGTLSPSGDAWEHAKALGLCRVASGDSWGVMDAKFVRADGVTPCNDSRQYRIVTDFGSGNQPTEGSQMVVYSSGTARDESDSGFVQPNGNGYDARTYSRPAHNVPAAHGCSSGDPGYDSCGLKLTIRAPTNVQSFSYNFDFFTSEYPEWLCSPYNDAFVAYYDGSLNPASDRNISFDSLGNPVSVNNGFFEIPSGWPPPSSGSNPLLNGSGYSGVCNNAYQGSTYWPNSICGGATGWLVTSAPINPGEEIGLQFSIWDTGDHKWDSAVLIDNFAWSAKPASIETGRYDPGESSATPLEPASFVRDYDATQVCNQNQLPTWTLWSWSATTPADSRIEFYITTAGTVAGLDVAPEDPLIFGNPPGPAALVDQNAVAEAGSPDTETGAVLSIDALEKFGRQTNLNHVRIRSYLVPSSDGLSAPTLNSWNLQMTCLDAQ